MTELARCRLEREMKLMLEIGLDMMGDAPAQQIWKEMTASLLKRVNGIILPHAGRLQPPSHAPALDEPQHAGGARDTAGTSER